MPASLAWVEFDRAGEFFFGQFTKITIHQRVFERRADVGRAAVASDWGMSSGRSF